MPDHNIDPEHHADHQPQGEDRETRELDAMHTRQAAMLGQIRYVLAIGTLLAFVLLGIIYRFFAMS